MNLNDLKIAQDIVNNFQKYDTLSKPPKINKLEYKVPSINGISTYEHGKDIESVKPNTLKYIIFHLHNVDYSLIIETTIALLYYWKFRKNKKTLLEETYKEIVNHYTLSHNNCFYNYNDGECVYLIKIYIGSHTLFKVGKTASFNQRMSNILSDVKSKYEYVSCSIEPLKVHYTLSSYEIEQNILRELKKDHKFFFNGHTESFSDKNVINIYNTKTKDYK